MGSDNKNTPEVLVTLFRYRPELPPRFQQACRQGLPVGMMLIGRHWEDGTVLRAADAFQIVG
jgi:hypothetical protein